MRNALNVWKAATLGAIGLSGALVACDEITVYPDPDADTTSCPTLQFNDIPGGQTIVEGKTLTVNLSASSPDQTAQITYDMAANPTGSQVDGDDGVFTFTPGFTVSTATEDGSFEVKFFATIPSSTACPSGVRTEDIKVQILVLNDEDQDGEADRDDLDDDGDGLSDTVDPYPLDKDGDDDGFDDNVDTCPQLANPTQADADGDDIGDACDVLCPNDPQNDPDGDLLCDGTEDNCPGVRNVAEDCDGNGATPPEQCDADEDGLGEVLSAASGESCDPCPNDDVNDPDDDRACAFKNNAKYDNCPDVANPYACDGTQVIDAEGNLTGEQCDADGDGLGDAVPSKSTLGCDKCPNDATNDQDADGVCEDVDNCPGLSNPPAVLNGPQANQDGDTLGDACDPDRDGDGDDNVDDNCPDAANGDQLDTDGDDIGDACDPDDDGDDVDDDVDNCPLVANGPQFDPDGDDVGFQCDDLETVPFALHQGTAVARVAGDAKSGTVALALRGPNPCSGAACVKPGVFVVDAADETYNHRQEAGDTTTNWLDMQPPAGDLDVPFVAQDGKAYFSGQTPSGRVLMRVDPDPVATNHGAQVVFPTLGVFGAPSFYDIADGDTALEVKTTSVASAVGLHRLEDLSDSGQPHRIDGADSYVDAAGNGPHMFLDETLYYPEKNVGGYTLRAFKKDGTSPVVTMPAGTFPTPATAVPVANVTSLVLLGPDRVMGSPWYCYVSNDATPRTALFQVHGGNVIHLRKLNFTVPCDQVEAHHSLAGPWFVAGPGSGSNTRVMYWVPDADQNVLNDGGSGAGDLFTASGVAAEISFWFTNGHTFIGRKNGTSTPSVDVVDSSQFYWWNPSAPGTLVEIGSSVIYDPIAAVDPGSNWFGVVGQTQPKSFAGSQLVVRRFRGGVSAAPGEQAVLVGSVQDFDGAANTWVGPNGAVYSEYVATVAANTGYFFNGMGAAGGVSGAVPATVQSGTVNVSFHGTTTLVSYLMPNFAGRLDYASEGGGGITLTKLVDTKGPHTAFEADAIRDGSSDAYVTYRDNGATPKFVVARVATTGTPVLTTVLSGLISPPSSVQLGPDGDIWFAYETDTGFGLASTSPTTLTKFVENKQDIQLVQSDYAVSGSHLWGAVITNAAGDHFACRAPVTLGAETSPAGCWQATDADATILWSTVDNRGVLYLASTAGAPIELSLFQSITAAPLTPGQIPQ